MNTNSRFFCHQCTQEIVPTSDFLCPNCHAGFIEEISPITSDEESLYYLPRGHQSPHHSRLPLNTTATSTQGTTSPLSHFFQNLLRRAPTTTSTLSSISPSAITISSQSVVSQPGYTAGGQHIPRSLPPSPIILATGIPQLRDHYANSQGFNPHGLETLLEQIMDWVGNGNAVFQMDPGGLITFMEYHSDDGGLGGSAVEQVPLFGLFGNIRDYAWGPGALENIMEQLFNQIEGQGIPPAPKDIIENLPTEVIQHEDIDQELQCSICMDYFKIKEKVKALPCDHWFHRDCIVPWLQLHGTCPICRKSVTGMETGLGHNSHLNPGPQSLHHRTTTGFRDSRNTNPPTLGLLPIQSPVPPFLTPPLRQFSSPLPPYHQRDPTTATRIHRPILRTFSNRNRPTDSNIGLINNSTIRNSPKHTTTSADSGPLAPLIHASNTNHINNYEPLPQNNNDKTLPLDDHSSYFNIINCPTTSDTTSEITTTTTKDKDGTKKTNINNRNNLSTDYNFVGLPNGPTSQHRDDSSQHGGLSKRSKPGHRDNKLMDLEYD